MNKTLLALLLLAVPAFAGLPAPSTPGAPSDARYCGEPARDKAGRIKRSRSALRQFVALNPCPATLLSSTTCAGWVIDHTWSLAVGGCDAPHNMTWMTDAAAKDKDRWELKYFAVPRQKVSQ